MNVSIHSIKHLSLGFSIGMTFAALAVPVVMQDSVKLEQDSIKRAVTIEYQLMTEPGIVTIDIQTNVSEGVWASIGGEHYRTMYGAVNRINTNTVTKSLAYWQPDVDWETNDPTRVNVRAVVTAWATNSPPDYMVVDLTIKSNLLFYANAESLPGGVTNRKYKTDCLVMRKVPAKGVIWRMGSPTGETGRNTTMEPPQLVVLSDDYYLGVYEVTQGQYFLICNSANEAASRPSTFTDGDADIRPVETDSRERWRGNGGTAQNFQWPLNGHAIPNSTWYRFGWLRTHSGLLFDLPTAAQWEYACRAGTGDAFNGGMVGEYAWYSGNSEGATHPVGTKKANAWGFYDMHGNVEERVLERSGYRPKTSSDPIVDPTAEDDEGASDSRRFWQRGGSWDSSEASCRSAAYADSCARDYDSSSKIGSRLWAPAVIPYR